jgi:nitroimidazol reductase NimA-like FMN-containing flavoprotein (pyridoxamine 5'-phosphate oxidase superfamily)
MPSEKITNISEMEAILGRCETGRFVTLDTSGYPYPLPVHYVYDAGHIYLHGKGEGEKIANMNRDARVAFEAEENLGYRQNGDSPCKVSTAYYSVVIRGKAAVLADAQRREAVLKLIAAKYAPQANLDAMTQEAIASTTVIEITIERMTGKKHN